MARTINGESWTTILEELRKFEPKEGEKEGRFKFYKVEQYRSRLIEVLGMNFSTVYSEPNYIVLNSGQEIISLLCTLTIRDDDGNIVCQSSGYAGRPIQYTQETGLCHTAHLTPAFAQAAALSQACKDIGVFGDVEDDYVPEYGNASGKKEKRDNKEKNTSKEEYITFLLYAPFREHTDKTGQTNYYLNAIKEDTGEKVELIFYGNAMKKKENEKNFSTIRSSVNSLSNGKKCRATLLCKKGSKGGYVVSGFKGA